MERLGCPVFTDDLPFGCQRKIRFPFPGEWPVEDLASQAAFYGERLEIDALFPFGGEDLGCDHQQVVLVEVQPIEIQVESDAQAICLFRYGEVLNRYLVLVLLLCYDCRKWQEQGDG